MSEREPDVHRLRQNDILFVGEPRRLRWDLATSPWNHGLALVEFGHRGELTVYAPPGTSLDGDRGLALACWRRGRWSCEAAFYERCAPEAAERMPMTAVRRAVPDDFHPWAKDEAAEHLTRLRTFSYHRDGAAGVDEAITALWSDLERAFPQAAEHHWESEESACEAPAATAPAAPAAELTPARMLSSLESRLSPLRMSRREWAELAKQFAALPLFYLLYRVFLRHAVEVPRQDVHADALLSYPPRSVLLWAYGQVHVVLAFAFMLWVYLRRNRAFPFVRNAVLAGSLLAIGGSKLAWKISGEPVYTLTTHHAVPPNAVPTMPALHLVIAVVLGVSGALLVRTRVAALLWIAYPVAVVAVIHAHPPVWLLPTVAAGLSSAVAGWVAMLLLGRLLHRLSEPPELAELRHALVPPLLRSRRGAERGLGVTMPPQPAARSRA